MIDKYAPPPGISEVEHTKLIEDILSILSSVEHLEKLGAPPSAAGKQALQEVLDIVPENIKQMALSSVPATKRRGGNKIRTKPTKRQQGGRMGRTIPVPANKNSNVNYTSDPTRGGVKPFPGNNMSGKKS